MADIQVILPALPQQEGVEFRHIPNFPGYCVGSDGSVWSCRKANRYWKAFRTSWRPRKLRLDINGYHCVHLSDGTPHSKLYRRHVHVLVIYAFHGAPPSPGMHCRHYDGDKTNNNSSNLRWGTPAENVADQIRHGTFIRGVRHHRAKVTEDDVRQIRAEYATGGTTLKKLGDRYQLSQHSVSKIVRRKSWAHVTDTVPVPEG